MTFTNGECVGAGGIVNNGTLTLTNVTVSHNTGVQAAGGIANDIDGVLTLIGSTVSDNTSTNQLGGQGGGLFNLGTASLIDTTVSGNSAPLQGSGIENRGQLRVINSRITNNTTAQGLGGGLENHSIVDLPTATVTVKLNRSAVTHKAAGGPIGGLGGRIVIANAGSLTLRSSPVTANTASTGGGGIYVFTGSASLHKSPVRGNQPDNCVNVPGC
jgi:hypothetical protein